MTREEIVAEARTWIGTPWKHQGRLKGRSCDCLGLIVGVLQKFEPDLRGFKDTRDYSHTPDVREAEKLLETYLAKIPREEAKPGDILRFYFDKDSLHLGFVTQKGMIHAYNLAGRKVTEHAIPPDWQCKIVRVYRIPGINDQ